jgi:hypothetical protein
MNKAVTIISSLLIGGVIIFCIVGGGTYVVFGGYISKSTEQKYLRNLDKFYLISKDHFSVHGHGDTLAFISDVPHHTPFHKWYISEVGTIRPSSLLSKKLDTLSKTWKNKKE